MFGTLKFRLFVLGLLIATIAYAHTDDTTVSRIEAVHPDLGHEGGSVLHTKVRDAWTLFGDNISSRYFEQTSVADSTTVNLDHNFGVPFDQIQVVLYDGTGTSKTRISDPVGAGWTFAAGTPATTILDVTTPGSGGPHDFTVEVYSGLGEQSGIALKRVDFDGETASNSSRITVPQDTKTNLDGLTRKEGTVWYANDEDTLYVDDGTDLRLVGSGGGGSGEVNFLAGDDSNFETTLGNWVAYDDGSVTDPVDGDGAASGNLIFGRVTDVSNPMRGEGFARLTPNGTLDHQGEGVRVDFNIEGADKGKILKIQMEYQLTDDGGAAFAIGDLGLYVRCDLDSSGSGAFFIPVTAASDGTNHNLLALKPERGGPQFIGTFLAPSDDEDLDCRMFIHRRTSSAGDWTLRYDDVIVGPGQIAQGAVVTDWKDFTLSTTWDASIDEAQTKARYRRVGTDMQVSVFFELDAGAPVTAFEMTLPAGVNVDTESLDWNQNRSEAGLNSMTIRDQSASRDYKGRIIGNSATDTVRAAILQPLTNGVEGIPMDMTSPFDFFGSTDEFRINFMVPIAEWAGKGVVNLIKEENLVPWREYTPDTASTDAGLSGNSVAFDLDFAEYRGVGDSIDVNIKWTVSGGPATSGLMAFPSDTWMPPGLTAEVDSINIANVGCRVADVSEPSGSNEGIFGAIVSAGQALNPYGQYDGGVLLDRFAFDFPMTWNTGDNIECSIRGIRVVEWKNRPSPLVGFSLADSENAGLLSREQCGSVALDNDYTGGTLRYCRIGKVVTVSLLNPTWTTDSSVNSSSGLLPVDYRPDSDAYDWVGRDSSAIQSLHITTTGIVQINNYTETDLGAGTAITHASSNTLWSTSYVVP